VPHTLLLADDSVTIQRVIELTFAGEDVDVVAVSDGDQAIARLESAPPDIVLADIGMPGKSGYEVAQYIKQSSKLAHIPVLLLTGAFEPVDQARASEAGCDGVLQKPFEPQGLITRVKELLANRRPALVSPAVLLSPEVPAVIDAPAPTMPLPMPIPAEDLSHQSVADQLLAEPVAPTAAIPGLDDYFDRLDAAFAGLGSPPVVQPAATVAQPPESPIPTDIDWFAPSKESPAPPAEQWDMPAPIQLDPGDLSLSYGSAPPELDPSAFEASAPSAVFDPVALFEREAREPAAIEPPPFVIEPLFDVRQPVVVNSPTPPAPAEAVTPSPSLAAVDHAWTASHQAVRSREPLELPSIADAFAALLAAEQSEPLPATAPAWPAAAPSDDALVEKVTRQVLAQLSDRVVRETVAGLVSEIAERLVREEIERIKASIR
jgi:CheY-like chemotaxis protein